MTFSAFEQSRQKRSPVALLEFIYGPSAGQVYRYTSNERDITIEGDVYEAVPIDIDSIVIRGQQGREEFGVSLPNDTDISALFAELPPPYPVSLIIKLGHRGDPDAQYNTIWTGKVLSGSKKRTGMTDFACEHAGVSLRRTALRRRYQRTCPFMLYGDECGASKAAATISTTVAGISGYLVTLASGFDAVNDLSKYIGGELSWSTLLGTERRTIVDAPGAAWTVQVSQTPRGLITGQAVDIALGCNHQTSDCNALHDNGPNFGGMAWIPTKNPINRNNY